MTFKRFILYILLILACANCAYAVLPENNVDMTVKGLLKDLQVMKEDIEFQQSQYETTRKEFWEETELLEDELDMAALVLHSQNEGWLFGMAQSTQLAYEATAKFKNRRKNLENWFENVNSSIQSIYAVRKQLEQINRSNLTPEGLKCLEESIQLCDEIEAYYNDYLEVISPDQARYQALEQKVNSLDESTHQTLNTLYNYIFVKGNEPYGSYLSHLGSRYEAMDHDLSNYFDKGQILDETWKSEVGNKWDNIFTVCSLLLSIALFIILRRLKKPSIFKEYASTWAVLLFFTFNIFSDLLTIIFTNPPLLDIKDLSIYMQFDLFAALILVLHIINKSQVKLRYVILLYTPLLLLTWIMICSIAELMPLTFVLFAIPAFYFMFIFTQAIILICLRNKISKKHKFNGIVNLVYVLICTIVACNGWVILSMILFLTWISLWGIILIVYLLKKFIDWKVAQHNSQILDYTMHWLINPVLLILAFVGSSYWVSSLFNLTSWFMEWLLTPFINLPNVCVISFAKLISVILLGIIVHYAIHITKQLLLKHDPIKYGSGKAAVVLSMASILAWLFYAIAVIVILEINHNGIIAAIGGASLGLGFAMRDTFENFFYGITMMAGRARPGDIVECDGIRGHVKHVGIISTSIETEDGPMVTLPNRQLFGRNFYNLTLNNRREIRHIVFDISDKNDIEKARQLMLEASKGIPGVVDHEKHYVVMKHTSCGIVRLDYKCWIDSERYLRTEPAVREAIFNAFKANGIEIAELLQTLDLKASSSIMTSANKGKSLI